jgi:hypothetical protein
MLAGVRVVAAVRFVVPRADAAIRALAPLLRLSVP